MKVFTGIGILLACFGLFGLSSYTMQQRVKEVGIRKVLGASVSGIMALLAKDFIGLIALSFIVAFPVAWWAAHEWLRNYAYRIDINWPVFLVTALLVLLIALITISFQSIKAAIANPVKSLRAE
jgi:putative ABC transport system permease protein